MADTPEEILSRLEKLFANRRRMSLYGRGIYPTKNRGQDSDVFVTGKDFSPVDSDGKPVTYQGKNILKAFAVTQFKGADEAILLRIATSDKFAAFCDDDSSGEGEGRSKRDIERTGKRKDGKKNVTGQIAYCYAVFIKRRINTGSAYKWFWQIFVGGWQEKNILVKEWEVLDPTTYTLSSPQAIVDFRKGTFYVSLKYFVWDVGTSSSQERYALLKGTKKEDVTAVWDKSLVEMLPGGFGNKNVLPRGFGYWSSDVGVLTSVQFDGTAQIWDGVATIYPPIVPNVSTVKSSIPQGWQKPPIETTSTRISGGTTSNSIVMYRLSEDGTQLLSALDMTTGYESGNVDTKTTMQDRLVWSFERVDLASTPVIAIDLPVGGNLPCMAKLAKTGNALISKNGAGDVFINVPYGFATRIGGLAPSNAPGTVQGTGSPYYSDVHTKFISAIQCPDLLNRGTVETQNIYGDLTVIHPLVSSASELAGVSSPLNGSTYGVTGLSKAYSYNVTSTTTADGVNVINASGSIGRWIYLEALPVSPATPDSTKLPGVLLASDIFPELQASPPASSWIGYQNIEHEKRTVEVFLWNPGLTAAYAQGSLKVEVQKMDAPAKIIADSTLQNLLNYTFMNASFG